MEHEEAMLSALKSKRYSALISTVSGGPALIFSDQWCSELKISALNSAVSETIGSESTMFSVFQVMYSAESELKQRCSALIISETEVMSAEILWDLNLGGRNNFIRLDVGYNFNVAEIYLKILKCPVLGIFVFCKDLASLANTSSFF